MGTVAIVEDHALLADTLCAALAERGVRSVTVSCEEPDLLQRILGAQPDLVLLDLDLGPAGDGNALIAPLTAAGHRVLVVTGSADAHRVAVALERGAVGYRRKESDFEALLTATCAALAGEPVTGELERRRLLRELAQHRSEQARAFEPFERLTEREREVLEALVEGRSVREMADDWVVSDATVRTHVRGLLGKLGTSSQLGAVAAALRSGWLRREARTGRLPVP